MTVQFGTGPSYAAQCPKAATPQGWRFWTVESDGAMPDALVARAKALATDLSVPLGTTESYPLPGVTALLVVQPHPWTRDDQGAVVAGCFHGVDVMVPTEAPPQPPPPFEGAGMSKTIGILTIASLSVGLLLTVPALLGGK